MGFPKEGLPVPRSSPSRLGRGSSDREFQDSQRVLSSHYAGSLVIIGIFLTLNVAGLAGTYGIIEDPCPMPLHRCYWLFGLGMLALAINRALLEVWLREGHLKERALARRAKYLGEEGTDDWSGRTGKVWGWLFGLAASIWSFVAVLALLGLARL
jgi:hypothetical protein